MDYGYNEKRSSKKDQRRKRRDRVFKRGGQLRSINLSGNKGEEFQ